MFCEPWWITWSHLLVFVWNKFEKIFSKVLEKNFACSLGWLESLESSRSQLIEFIALFIVFPFARW